MKISNKLALVAAASLMTVSSFAMDMSSIDLTTLEDLAVAELAAPGTSTADGAVALISQTGSAQIAMITQVGANNFAVIVQAQDSALAAIVQDGDSNIAYISQK